MATTFIKIDRESIRNNPNAGRASTIVAGPVEVSFELKGPVGIPPDWKDMVIVTEENWSDTQYLVKGILKNPDHQETFIKALATVGEYKIDNNRDIVEIKHMPEPTLLYNYQNTTVECSSCHSHIIWKAIQEEETPDGESLYETCPVCGEFDTFDYELEKIEDVTKRENNS